MDKNVMMAVVLGLLLVVSVVQAFQLSALKEKVASGALSGARVSAPVASGASSGGNPSLPANIQNLPSMVGGC
jgi:hypothetical protein